MFKSKINMKLFPIYKMFSYDLLFYYAISFLFLTQEKNFSTSQVISADSFYIFFKMFVQFICIILVDKLGKKNCLIAGNILVAFSIYILVIGSTFSHVLISFFIMALGYSFKDLCESTLLYNSIPECEKKRTIFGKIDGKCMSLWYFLDSITSIIAGFCFTINPYLPMYFCIACLIVSNIICFGLEDDSSLNSLDTKSETVHSTQLLKENIKDIKYSFRFIFKSKRLRALFMFSVVFYSILDISSTLRSSLLVDLNFPDEYFGIITAIYGIIASISSKKQEWFQEKFGNKVLAFFSMSMCFLFISTGIIGMFHNSSIIIILILFSIRNIVKGPYNTLMNKYFNSFSSNEISSKIFSANSLLISVFSTIILQLSSLLMQYVTTAQALLTLGIIFFIAFIFILQYMKTRVGLKPEEYNKSDIEYIKVK